MCIGLSVGKLAVNFTIYVYIYIYNIYMCYNDILGNEL